MASLLLLEDDSRALEDALAFLDEWHAGSVASRSSLSPSRAGHSSDGSLCDTDGSTSSSPPPTPAPTAVRKATAVRKTTVDKRKDEIRMLRRQAEDLHSRAELLRQLRRQVARDPAALGTMSATGLAKSAMLVAMWKGVAQRQQRIRGQSEAENARLRSEVADQDMMLKAIRSMLKRRKRKPAVSFVSSAVTSAPSANYDGFRQLEKLCDLMEVEAFQDREMPLNYPVALPGQPPAPQITHLSPTKVLITYHESRAVPFAFVDVSALLWESVQKSCLSLGSKIITEMKVPNGLIFRGGREEFQFDEHSFALNCFFAARPRHDFHRAGYVFGGQSMASEINGKAVSGISFKSRGAMVMSRVLDSYCQMEAVFHVEIDVAPSVACVNARHMDTLANAVANANVQRYDTMFSVLETMLLGRAEGAAAC